MIDARTVKIGWITTAVISAAYVASLVRLTSFPMQDYANHIARADIMADLLFHHGSRFGPVFQLHLAPVPYVLPDLMLTGAVGLLGVPGGAGVFTGLVLLSLPCALLFYARSCNIAPRTWPFIFLLGLYLSIDWFFVVGFMAYRLSLALIIVNLAIAEVLRRRWSMSGFFAYLIVLVLGFLTHLTAPVFVGAAVGVSALVRLGFKTTTVRREIYLLAPIVVLLAWFFAATSGSHTGVASFGYDWAGPGGGKPWARKIRNLQYEFVDFDQRLAIPIILLFAGCVLWTVRRELNQAALLSKPVVESLALAVAFLAIYFGLPSQTRDTMFVDVRALPMITLFLLFACLRLAPEASAGQTFGNSRALGVAALLAFANLLYVTLPLNRNNTWIERYRAVVAAVPNGAYVLPVNTETKLQYLLHVPSHVVLDRGAVSPYLFSDNFGDAMTYFRYKSPPYTPDFHWYRAQLFDNQQAPNEAVDWNRVACDYDFLLVTMPFNAALIRVPTAKIASNEAAALLAIDKHACRKPTRPQASTELRSGHPVTPGTQPEAPA